MDFHTSTWTVWDLELGATRTDCNWEEVVESLRGITNRKTFRNTRGGSNPVWPMELECALVQGLSRHVSLRGEQGRNRSRFISDFILETTNQIRTPKQVSSRLQHLRNSTKTVWVRRLIERRPVSTVSVDQNPTAFINNLPIRLNTEALPPEAQSVPCAGTSLVELPTRLNTEALPPEAQSVPCAGTSLVELERERSHAIEMYNRVLIHSGVGMPSNDEFNSTGFSSQTDSLMVAFNPIEEYERHSIQSNFGLPWVSLQENLSTAQAMGYNEVPGQTLILPPVQFSGSLAPSTPSFYSNDGYLTGQSINNTHFAFHDVIGPCTNYRNDAYAWYNFWPPIAYGEYVC